MYLCRGNGECACWRGSISEPGGPANGCGCSVNTYSLNYLNILYNHMYDIFLWYLKVQKRLERQMSKCDRMILVSYICSSVRFLKTPAMNS